MKVPEQFDRFSVEGEPMTASSSLSAVARFASLLVVGSIVAVTGACSSGPADASSAPEVSLPTDAPTHIESTSTDPPPPTTKTDAQCLNESYACAALCPAGANPCLISCTIQKNMCLLWTSCSRTYFSCAGSCTNRLCSGFCLMSYHSCMAGYLLGT